MRTVICLAAMLVLAGTACAGAGERADSAGTVPVTGNVGLDLFGMRTLDQGPRLEAGQGALEPGGPGRKSVLLAAALSLVVPGAGEFYAESYWKSALFVAVEAAAWGVAYYWDKRGDRQTDSYQNFADAHWSVVQYAQYAVEHLAPQTGNYQWLKEGTEGKAPWDRVNWSELNRMERDIAGYYSHTLPPHGDQQYFEMIGKYPQFNQGWNDANPALASDYASMKANLTPNFLHYAGERGKSNTYYGRATTFVTVAIINHVISAVDAAFTAGSFNNRVHAEMGFQTVPDGGISRRVPVLKLAYSF